MKSLVITQLILAFSGSVIGDGCCRSKVVEGSTYTLQGEEDTSSFSCVDRCTYTKEGEANSKFCFADGDLQVECKDSTGGVADTTPGGGGGAAATVAGGTVAPGTKVTWPLKTTIFTAFQKYTTVFGIKVFADATVTDAQFQHLASVTAEWLDNDQDGCVDNPLVLTKMTPSKRKPCIVAPGKDGSWDEAAQMALEKG